MGIVADHVNSMYRVIKETRKRLHYWNVVLVAQYLFDINTLCNVYDSIGFELQVGVFKATGTVVHALFGIHSCSLDLFVKHQKISILQTHIDKNESLS